MDSSKGERERAKEPNLALKLLLRGIHTLVLRVFVGCRVLVECRVFVGRTVFVRYWVAFGRLVVVHTRAVIGHLLAFATGFGIFAGICCCGEFW